jgi:hypothetical protein
VAQTLLQFPIPVVGRDGTEYKAQACGAELPGGLWEGWVEFVPLHRGQAVRTPRETTQPNRIDAEYWASGLSAVYLEGALERALHPTRTVAVPATEPPIFAASAPSGAHINTVERHTESVLDPFQAYEKGETLLRKQLAALSSWHLVNIIIDYELSEDDSTRLNQLPAAALIDCIVTAVRKRQHIEGTRTSSRRR